MFRKDKLEKIKLFKNIAANTGGILCEWNGDYESPMILMGENSTDAKPIFDDPKYRGFPYLHFLMQADEFAMGYFDNNCGYYRIFVKSRSGKVPRIPSGLQFQEFTESLKQVNFCLKRNKIKKRLSEMEADFNK